MFNLKKCSIINFSQGNALVKCLFWSFSVFASIFLSSNIDFTFSFKCQCKVFFNSNYQILPCSILAESSAMWLSSRLSTMQALSWSCWINAGQIRTKSSSFNPSSSFTSWSSRSSCPVKHWNTYANVKLLGHAFKYSVHVNYRDMKAWNFYTISFINSKCMCQRQFELDISHFARKILNYDI